jgi:cation-transporting P-type ATPase C
VNAGASGGWLARAEPAHAVPGRVRFACRFRPGTPTDWPALARAAEAALPGVRSARASAAARSLVLFLRSGDSQAEVGALREALLRLPIPAGDPGGEDASAEPDPVEESRRALVVRALALLGAFLLPGPLRLPLTLAAGMPLLREGAEDLLGNGAVTSRVLEAAAVAISLGRRDHVAANTTTSLLALGTFLGARTARRSDRLLRGLLRPSDGPVWVLREDGTEIGVAARDVAVGDAVVVGAGASVPVDGTVLSGAAEVDEAALTGEGAPVPKSRGARMLSGSVVRAGRIVVCAETVGADTAAARIAAFVERSLAAKGRAQMASARLAERLVPATLAAAGGSLLATGGDWRGPASVLQADFACALKLATPLAFKGAMYEAGRAGVLVKGADALERLAEADTFVFDKTGTLTTGTLEVSEVAAFDRAFGPEDLVNLAASLEEHYSFHPVAAAVVRAARSSAAPRHFDHQEVDFVVAHGVASAVEGKRIVVGSRHFVEEDEGVPFEEHRALADRLEAAGRTALCVGLGGRLLGVLGLRDAVRPEAAGMVRRLRALGARRILLLTGDTAPRAAELAAALGLDGFRAGLLPEDKARIVDELAAGGARVAFVGDGVNDAAALARAHVGVAMHRGSDAARLTADVVLLEDDVGRVAAAREAANDAMRAVGTSFRLAVGLNAAILALAALGRLSPFATAVLHNGSTVGILANVLRRGQRPPGRARGGGASSAA